MDYMPTTPLRRDRPFRKNADYLVMPAMAIAVLVLIGWVFNVEVLKRPLPLLVAPSPFAAISFLVLGTSLLLLNAQSPVAKTLPYALAVLTSLIGMTVLYQLFSDTPTHLDTLFFRRHFADDVADSDLMRMGPYTATSISLGGIAVLFTIQRTPVGRALANLIALVIFMGALFAVIGYFYHIKELYGGLAYKPMAIQTAISFMLTGIAIMLHNPKAAYMAIVTHRNTGGTIARILVPATILVPILLGYILLEYPWNPPMSAELSVNFLITGIVLLFFCLVLFVAFIINKKDQLRIQAEKKLADINTTLEQKVMESVEELRTNDKRFSTLIENSLDVFALYDERMQVFYLSPSFEKVTGFSIRERMENPGMHFLHPADVEKGKKLMEDVLNNPGVPIPFQTRQLHTGNRYIWVEGTIANFLYDKNIRAIVSNYRDITVRKHHEQELESYNQRISGILETINDGFFVCNRSWNILYWNRAAEETMNIPRKVILGQNFWQAFPGSTSLKAFTELNKTMYEGKPVALEEYYNDTWFGLNAYPSAEGISVFFRNITEPKRQEKLDMLEKDVLHFFNQKQNTLQEAITLLLNGIREIHPEMLCSVLKLEGDRLHTWSSPHLPANFNEAIEGGVIGSHAGSCGTAAHRKEVVIVSDIETDPLWQDYKDIALRNNLRACWSHPILDEGKHVLGTFAIYYKTPRAPKPPEERTIERARIILNNIIENQLADEQILKLNAELEERVILRTQQLQEANKELEAFSYSVSHDLRAPIRSIQGFANMIIEDFGNSLGESGMRPLNNIVGSARRMNQLIDDLLNFSRAGKVEISRQQVDMNQVVKETLDEILGASPNPSIVWHIDDLQTANADPNLIRQVWVNLLSNAIKYSGIRQEPVISVTRRDTTDTIVFSVQDNGAGFDMKYYAKLFGVFQRLHGFEQFPGTGVGLAIVQRILSRHGGTIWAESQPDKGATFYFSLPRA